MEIIPRKRVEIIGFLGDFRFSLTNGGRPSHLDANFQDIVGERIICGYQDGNGAAESNLILERHRKVYAGKGLDVRGLVDGSHLRIEELD